MSRGVTKASSFQPDMPPAGQERVFKWTFITLHPSVRWPSRPVSPTHFWPKPWQESNVTDASSFQRDNVTTAREGTVRLQLLLYSEHYFLHLLGGNSMVGS